MTSCFVRSFPFTATPCTSHALCLSRLKVDAKSKGASWPAIGAGRRRGALLAP